MNLIIKINMNKLITNEELKLIREKRKIYYQSKKEKIVEYSKEYYKQNKAKALSNAKEYKNVNKDKLKIKRKEYLKNNINNTRKTNNINKKKRLLTDKLFKVKVNISSLIAQSFKNKSLNKQSKTIDILGCDYIQFKQHLESKFEPWMNWDNYGNPKDGIFELNKTWDIDHIIPLSTASSEEDIVRLNHYTNLQPLCSYTNRFLKRDK
jgi:hypothetical protein